MKDVVKTIEPSAGRCLLAVAISLMFVAVGCGDQVSGPQPDLEGEDGDPQQQTTQPGFSCVDNRTEQAGSRWVTVKGSNFAPVVRRALEDEDVQPPTVELRRTRDLYGEFDGEQDSEVFGDGEDSDRLRWKNPSTVEFRIDNEVDLKGGLYDVIVTNPSGESARKKRAFGILPRPTVSTIRPDLTCLEQGNRTVTVRGGPFVTNPDEDAEGQSTPEVQIGGKLYSDDSAVEAVDCRELDGPFGDYQACSGLRLTIDQDAFDPGAYDVSVTNIRPARCSNRTQDDGISLRVTPPPTVDSIERAPLCSKQKTYENLRIQGSDFIRVENDNGVSRPEVRIEGKSYRARRLENCDSIDDLTNEKASRCSTAVVKIPSGDLDRVAEGTMTPLQSVQDAGTSDADGGTSDGDSGSDDTSESDGGTDGGEDGTSGDAGDVGPADAGDAGDAGFGTPGDPSPENPLTSLDVVVENPSPAGCTSSSTQLPVIPPPMVHDSTPDPICNGPERTITIDGTGFMVLDEDTEDSTEQVPSVTIDGTSYEATSYSNCLDSDAGELTAWSETDYTDGRLQLCDQIQIEVPSEDISKGGTREVTVENPQPASCRSEGSAPLQSTPIPTVSGVEPKVKPAPDSAADPVCTVGQPRTVVVYGSNLYAVDGDKPEVSFSLSGMEQDSFEADRMLGCQEVGVDGMSEDARRCGGLQVTLTQDALSTLQATTDKAVKSFQVGVTNPGGTSCATANTETFHIAAGAEVTGISENFACLADGGRQFTVNGSRILKDTRSGRTTRPMVRVDDQFYRADSVSDCNPAGVSSPDVQGIERCQTLTFTVPQKAASVTVNTAHDVSVIQPGTAACQSSSAASLDVDPAPTVTEVQTPYQQQNWYGRQFATDQDPVCSEQLEDELRVQGEDFYLVEDASAPSDESVSLAGSGGSNVSHRLPRVEIAGTSYDATEVSIPDTSQCSQIRSGTKSVYECPELAVDTPAGKKGLSGGTHQVRVQNPINDPASFSSTSDKYACTSETDERVRMTDPPKISQIQPEPICTAEGRESVRVVGGDFLFVDPSQQANPPQQGLLRRPAVTFTCKSGGCSGTSPVTFTGADIQGRNCLGQPTEKDEPRVENCNAVRVRIEQNELDAGTYSVQVQNPFNAECSSNTVDFSIVDPPQLDDLDPQMACVEDQNKVVTATGQFLVKEKSGNVTYPTAEVLATPTQTYNTYLRGKVAPSSSSNCTQLNLNSPSGTFYECTEVLFEVGQGTLTQGNFPTRIRNPQPAECASDTTTEYIKPDPTVTSVAPSPVCTEDNDYQVTVGGQNFYEVDGNLPTVSFSGQLNTSNADDISVSGIGSCAPASNVPSPSDRTVRRCQELTVDIPEDELSPNATSITQHQVQVTNPSPLECTSDENELELDVPEPQVTANNNTLFAGSAKCPGEDRLVVTGDYFVEMGGRTPSRVEVWIDGNREVYNDAQLRGNSNLLQNTSETTRVYSKLQVELDKHGGVDVQNDTIEVRVQNPTTVQCTSARKTINANEVTPQIPDIRDVQPTQTCSTNSKLTIKGEKFSENGVTALINGQTATSINYVQKSTDSDNKRDIIEATWASLRAGSYDVVVENPNGCRDTWGDEAGETEVSVVDGPLAVYLDPPTHYNEIELEGLLYFTNGKAQDIKAVKARGPNGTVRDLNFSLVTDSNGNVVDDQLSVTLPDEDPASANNNPLPVGQYDIKVVQQYSNTACGQWQSDLLEVVGNTALNLTNIDPAFGEQGETTSVEVTEDGGTPAFQSTPRVYLNPGPNTTGTSAVELQGTAFQSSTKVTGIVSDSLPLGKYQVIAINPNGDVGVLPASSGFEVVDDPPPVIDTVNPGSWESPASAYEVDVIGQDFRGNTSTIGIDVFCNETGQLASSNINVTGVSSTKVDLEVDTGSLNAGEVCQLTVTNPDGTNDSFSPIPIFNPAFNFVSYTDGVPLIDKRRGLTVSSGKPSRQQRFLYAAGGDQQTGPIGTPLTSVEYAGIDDFGNTVSPEGTGTFNKLRYELDDTPNGSTGQFLKDIQNGRAFADEARLRDFVYVVGGNDGTTASDDVMRANVLDPLHSPDIVDIDFTFNEKGAGGLDPGTYYYRVSAVHDDTSDHNPSGETLTSSVQPVYVPDLDGFTVDVTIEWDSDVIDNSKVDKYRLYRSPQPGDPAGSEKLLVEKSQVSGQNRYKYDDDGNKNTTSQEFLPVGSLGTWHVVANLNQARQRHEVRMVVDPSDSSKAYLYVMGGESTAGGLTALDSIERVTISDTPGTKRDASITGVTDLTSTNAKSLSSARTELDGYVAAPSNADVTDKYLYAIGGKAGIGGGATDTVDIWPVQAGGSLGSRKSTNDTPSDLSGEIKKRAGFVGTIANDFGVNFGGQGGDADGNGSNTSCTGGAQNCTGGLKDSNREGDIVNWNSLGGIDMTPRYQHGGASFVGFLYLAGGQDDNDQVVDSVEYSPIGTTRRD